MRVRRAADAQRPPQGHIRIIDSRKIASDVWRAGRGRPTDISARRRDRLARLIAFARERSPYYRNLYGHLPRDVSDLSPLPPVTKNDLMTEFDAWVTDAEVTREGVADFINDPARIGELYLGRHLAFATSGTTGKPAIFLHDPDAAAVYAALLGIRRFPTLFHRRGLMPFLRQAGRTATIIATGGHFASSVVEGLVRRRHPFLYGRNRTFSILSPLSDLVASLNDFRPAVLGSYPTALTVLAQEQAAGRLRIDPALALTGAEWLSPSARMQIAAAFRCPVRDTYAASEFMGIAFDCRHGRLHVNADWVILEPVDASFRPVPPGEPSHTCLLTNLANRVQPLIRYDLGDRVTAIPSPCLCGSPLPVIQVEGRRDEILYLEGPEGRTFPMLPMVVATVVEEAPGVRSYQVIQRGPALLCLRIEEAPGADRRSVGDDVVRRLRGYLSSRGMGWVAVERTEEPPQREPSGGKLRQVFSAFP